MNVPPGDNEQELRHPHKGFNVSQTMNRLKDSFVGHTAREYQMAVSNNPSFDDDDGANCNDYEEIGNYQHYLYTQREHDRDESMEWQRKRRASLASSSMFTSCKRTILQALHQLPAVMLIAMFHLMIGVPFGVSYFPIGWREQSSLMNEDQGEGTDDNIHGAFPIAGKDALGIR